MSSRRERRPIRSAARVLGLVAAATLMLACDVSTPTEIRIDPWGEVSQFQVQMVSGHGQVGTPGQPLGDPFVVRVVNRYGQTVSGASIIWTVMEGEGRLPVEDAESSGVQCETKSDALGLARVTLTLGPAAGRNAVEASPLFSPSRVQFEATGRTGG